MYKRFTTKSAATSIDLAIGEKEIKRRIRLLDEIEFVWSGTGQSVDEEGCEDDDQDTTCSHDQANDKADGDESSENSGNDESVASSESNSTIVI